MKKIKLVIITLVTCLLFVGCSNNYKVDDNSSQINDNKSYKSNIIEDIKGNRFTATEYIDESTGVHYLIVQQYQNTISVTPMYNADGTLKVTK